MVVFKSIPNFYYAKNRPKRYKASDAPYAVGGNKGVVLARLPRKYPMTPQQRRIKEIARTCGIHKGMSKAELMKAMKECIPSKF